MLDLRKCETEQVRLASKISLKDDFSKLSLIGGAGIYMVDRKMVGCAVVCDAATLETQEKTF